MGTVPKTGRQPSLQSAAAACARKRTCARPCAPSLPPARTGHSSLSQPPSPLLHRCATGVCSMGGSGNGSPAEGVTWAQRHRGQLAIQDQGRLCHPARPARGGVQSPVEPSEDSAPRQPRKPRESPPVVIMLSSQSSLTIHSDTPWRDRVVAIRVLHSRTRTGVGCSGHTAARSTHDPVPWAVSTDGHPPTPQTPCYVRLY